MDRQLLLVNLKTLLLGWQYFHFEQETQNKIKGNLGCLYVETNYLILKLYQDMQIDPA